MVFNEELKNYVDFSKVDMNSISKIEQHLINKYSDDPLFMLNGKFTENGFKLKVEDLEKNYISQKFFQKGCYDKIFEKMEAPESYINAYSELLNLSNQKLLQYLNEELEYLYNFRNQLERELMD